MQRLFAIGEILIDFIPQQKGKALKDVVSFERAPGGAPANVAAAVAKLGGNSYLISKLGEDAFGDFLIEQLQEAGVNVDKVLRTSEANTGLAFVSLREDGERDFSFYRNPSSDLLLTEDEIDDSWFQEGDILHFCSVDLVESPMKQAHRKTIASMKEKGGLISFDPNVRLSLWHSKEACRKTILEFIPLAHLVKISDEELSFITGIEQEEKAIQSLFVGDVQVVVYTKGPDGASVYTKNAAYYLGGYKVNVQDTTGAGDAWIGGFLYQLLEKKITQHTMELGLQAHANEILAFANASGAITTTGKGAISSLPMKEEICAFMKERIE
ncbi:carbohydrate kinase [Ectobacillus sp. sgz5001026]|uniref:carbohydrate kinase family protein n=1 Tax=Ectobacillus sp. sgz5001026 TaxID=3242473 RepID=UPI0036D2DB16